MTKPDATCPLCNLSWDYHTVITKQVKMAGGRIGIKPIGWNCPERTTKKEEVQVDD